MELLGERLGILKIKGRAGDNRQDDHGLVRLSSCMLGISYCLSAHVIGARSPGCGLHDSHGSISQARTT